MRFPPRARCGMAWRGDEGVYLAGLISARNDLFSLPSEQRKQRSAGIDSRRRRRRCFVQCEPRLFRHSCVDRYIGNLEHIPDERNTMTMHQQPRQTSMEKSGRSKQAGKRASVLGASSRLSVHHSPFFLLSTKNSMLGSEKNINNFVIQRALMGNHFG